MYERTVRREIERSLVNIRVALEEQRSAPQEQVGAEFSATQHRLEERYNTLVQVLELIDTYPLAQDDTDCFLPDGDGDP